ncbi:ClpX C4-type zinc finger protein [Desulfococcus sp.]|uniref:ClpX C4-type zinc finger protein n=1 Tax=Desulfococcus sp. TaxID=2025834 RepID=UPI00359318E6
MAYDILYCALCGKNYNDVNKLITDDDVTLCDVCYDFCAAAKGDEETNPPEVRSGPAADR